MYLKPSLLRAVLLAMALIWPLEALAEAPASVTNVSAIHQDGQIRVRWDRVEGEISSYLIYFSRNSIVRGNGAFDDYEIVSGDISEHVLTDFPAGEKLYLTVLAKNADGEESPSFISEAEVDLVSSAPIKTDPVTEPTPVTEDGMVYPEPVHEAADEIPLPTSLKLLSAESISSTGVLLKFSLPVTVTQADAPLAFRIVNAVGQPLTLRSLIMQDTTITLLTAPQTEGMTYTIYATRISSLAASGTPLTLDPPTSMTTFVGKGGATTGPALPPVGQTTAMDVSNLRLRSQTEGNGLYTVLVDFEAPASTEGISSFELRQTRGVNMGPSQLVASNVRSIRFSGVPPGNFGVMIRTLLASGTMSQGSFASLSLPFARDTDRPLSTTGAGFALIIALSGSAAGWRYVGRAMRSYHHRKK